MGTCKNIVILGSTGSIGTQALEVIAAFPGKFQLFAITANKNADLLIRQALCYKPKKVVITAPEKYEFVKQALKNDNIDVLCGYECLSEVVHYPAVDAVLTAIVGFAGLLPTISAIKAKKQIALANKETLVVAGELITKLARENGVDILPVDSEHSAIFQCLAGEKPESVECIHLTASGGPFRTKTLAELEKVTRLEALKHPNWVMGAKITIDSASLMNKGLEVIEAKWLFDLKPEQIKVIVHPQSIVHSLVQFRDGSIKAQLGLPDMKLPILYAFSFPERWKTDFQRFDFLDYPALTFEQADTHRFKNLLLAYKALEMGGNAPCIINAANEEVVNAFLTDKLRFLQMPEIIEQVLHKTGLIMHPEIGQYIETDKLARELARQIINKQ